MTQTEIQLVDFLTVSERPAEEIDRISWKHVHFFFNIKRTLLRRFFHTALQMLFSLSPMRMDGINKHSSAPDGTRSSH